MKAVILFLVMLVIWYFAGMFHQIPLMVLSVCLFLVPLTMCCLAIYQHHHLKITLPKPKDIAFKKIEKEVTVLAENSSRLPVNRYRLKLQLKYTTDKHPVRKKFSGCAGGRSMNEENLSYFYLQAPYCGIIEWQIKKATVYDPLSIFFSVRKMSEKGQLIVFPVEKPMQIEMPLSGRYDNLPVAETHSSKTGDDHSEVRQIREYQPGDLSRHIHRNYSARTDTLWVKEFSKENDYIFDLLLDTTDTNIGTDEWDAFYEIIFSVMLALLKKDIYINVHWYDKQRNAVRSYRVDHETEAAEVLAQLYLADKACTPEVLYASLDPQQEGLMIINTHLEWYFSGQPVYAFHKETVEQELSSMTFCL